MSSEKDLSFLPHLLSIFTGFVGPLITFIVGEGDLKEHSKKSLNWQLSLVLYIAISFVLMLILIGIFFFIALIILDLVFSIIAIVKASKGELWDYPLAIKFFK